MLAASDFTIVFPNMLMCLSLTLTVRSKEVVALTLAVTLHCQSAVGGTCPHALPSPKVNGNMVVKGIPPEVENSVCNFQPHPPTPQNKTQEIYPQCPLKGIPYFGQIPYQCWYLVLNTDNTGFSRYIFWEGSICVRANVLNG